MVLMRKAVLVQVQVKGIEEWLSDFKDLTQRARCWINKSLHGGRIFCKDGCSDCTRSVLMRSWFAVNPHVGNNH